MKLFKLFILTSFLYLLTGCSQKVEFNQTYIKPNIKQDLKKVNIEKVDIKTNENIYLKKHPNATGVEIAKKLSLSLPAVYRHLKNFK